MLKVVTNKTANVEFLANEWWTTTMLQESQTAAACMLHQVKIPGALSLRNGAVVCELYPGLKCS